MWRVLHSEWCDREVNVSRVCLHQMDLERLSWRPRFNLHLRATWDTFIRDWDKATEAMGAVGGVIKFFVVASLSWEQRRDIAKSNVQTQGKVLIDYKWTPQTISKVKFFDWVQQLNMLLLRARTKAKDEKSCLRRDQKRRACCSHVAITILQATNSSGWQHWQRKNALDNLHIRFLRAKNQPQKGCWPPWPECRTPSQSEGLEAKKSLVLQPSECDPRRMFRSSLP